MKDESEEAQLVRMTPETRKMLTALGEDLKQRCPAGGLFAMFVYAQGEVYYTSNGPEIDMFMMIKEFIRNCEGKPN